MKTAASLGGFVAVVLLAMTPGVSVPAGEPATSQDLAVYVKVLFPDDHPYWSHRARQGEVDKELARGTDVESWIPGIASQGGKADLKAVTTWIRLPDHGEENVSLFSGYDCPAFGRVGERTKDGKIQLVLAGWAPFPPEIRGQVISAEIGTRAVATVHFGDSDDPPNVYVAAIVAPVSR